MNTIPIEIIIHNIVPYINHIDITNFCQVNLYIYALCNEIWMYKLYCDFYVEYERTQQKKKKRKRLDPCLLAQKFGTGNESWYNIYKRWYTTKNRELNTIVNTDILIYKLRYSVHSSQQLLYIYILMVSRTK